MLFVNKTNYMKIFLSLFIATNEQKDYICKRNKEKRYKHEVKHLQIAKEERDFICKVVK
jgi:hypothetical protein